MQLNDNQTHIISDKDNNYGICYINKNISIKIARNNTKAIIIEKCTRKWSKIDIKIIQL